MGSRLDLKGDPKTVQELTIRHLIDRCHLTALTKGWWEESEDTFTTKIALIHSEASEALEDYRNGIPLDEVNYEHKSGWSNSPTRDYGNGPIPGKPIGPAVE